MEEIVFRNRIGESITLSNREPFILTSIDGTGGADTDIQMQKAPYQDGTTYVDTILEPRVLTIEAAILASSEEELYQRRNQILNVFNPKLGTGTLTYAINDTEKEIKCIPELTPQFPTGRNNKSARYQTVLLTLLCPSPFWEDVFITSEEMADFIGGLEFPLEIPFEGIEFERNGNNRVIVLNSGNVDTPVTLIFFGAATNPMILNETTGEYIKVNKSLDEGERLVITTGFGNKKVIFDNGTTRSNAMGFIDLGSAFWQLKRGDNSIVYTVDSGINTSRLLLQYKNRYVGI